MANRYWVGGTANWDGTAGTKWALTSGGSGGEAVPTSADDVFFDGNSGANTVTISTGNTGSKSINCTGFTGTLNGTAAITISSCSMTLVSGMTYSYTGTITFQTASGTLTSAGKTFANITLTLGGAVTCTLGDALTSTGSISHTNGTFNLNNFTLTCNSYSSSSANAKTLAFGTGNITATGTGTAVSFTQGYPTVTGTPIINVTNSTATATTVIAGVFSEGNSISYNFTSGTYSLTFLATTTHTARNVDFTGFAGTWEATSTATIYGNLKLSSGMTLTSSASAMTLGATSGTQNITSNGKTIDFPITMNGSGGTFKPLDTFTLASARTLTLTAGTLDLSAASVSTGLFDGSGTGTRAIAFGSNSITVTGNGGTVVNVGGASGFTYTGTFNITSNYTGSTGTRTFNANLIGTGVYPTLATSGANINIGTVATDIVSLTGSWGNIDFTNYTQSLANATRSLFGNITFSSGMTISSGTSVTTFAATSGTQNITSNGQTLNFPLTFNGVGGTFKPLDALTVGSTRTTTLTNGTLDLSAANFSTGLFSSSNSNTRTIAFGSNSITVSGTGAAWATSPVTNFTTTGTPVVNVTNSTATATSVTPGSMSEANSISFNFTAGTYVLTFLLGSGHSAKNVNFTGFSGSWSPSNVSAALYGNIVFSPTMTITSGSTLNFRRTSGTQNITTNGKIINFSISFNGAGGIFKPLDALTMESSRVTTLTNGTLDLNGNTFTVGTSFATGSGTKNLTFNGGTLVCPAATATAFNNAQPTNFTTTAGTGTGKISMTAATAKTFVGGGGTYNCTLSNDGAGVLTITGSNTITTIANGVQPTTFTFTSGTTTTIANWNVSGTSGNLVTIGSDTSSSHTLSKSIGIVSANYLSISYSTATGGATWYAGDQSVDGGNNSGWIFTLPNYSNFTPFFS